jgi:hypothetical protein
MNTRVQTSTLALLPWAAEALSLDEEAAIAARAVELHCRVSVGKSRHTWTIRVSSWDRTDAGEPVRSVNRHHQRGHLADLIGAALDAYTNAYTADELLMIANQSGMAVTRA